MMTTTTTEAPAGYAELEAAQEAAEVARQERARLGAEHHKYATDLGRMEAELRELATSEPDQFDDHGQPRKGTRAAKLRSELDQGASSRWPDVIPDLYGRRFDDQGRRVSPMEMSPTHGDRLHLG